MSRPGPVLPFIALFLFVLSMLACGGGNRQLQSMSISPASASVQVQFTAIGTFSGSSKPSAVNALWWTNPPWTFPPMTPNVPFITVSSNGLAQCAAGAPSGTYPVWAVAPVDPSVPLSQMTMTTKQIVAMAQLTCP
jgi:hypothetical protein